MLYEVRIPASRWQLHGQTTTMRFDLSEEEILNFFSEKRNVHVNSCIAEVLDFFRTKPDKLCLTLYVTIPLRHQAFSLNSYVIANGLAALGDNICPSDPHWLHLKQQLLDTAD